MNGESGRKSIHCVRISAFKKRSRFAILDVGKAKK